MTELARTLHEVAWYPPHDPRTASPEYRHTHDHLVVELDTPCWICGVRNSQLAAITDAPTRKWSTLETHHAEIEWAAEKAFEDDGTMLTALVADLGQTIAAATPDGLREFLDSEGNMLVLCALHHRGPQTGIHSITYPCWKLQRYQFTPGAFQFVRPTS